METPTIDQKETNTKAKGLSVKKTFPVLGMTCAGCAASVESMLQSTKGVSIAAVNYANQTALVDYNPQIATPLGMQQAIRSVGYDLILDEQDPIGLQQEIQHKEYQALQKRTILAFLLSAPVAIIGMFFMHMSYASWISMVL